MGKAVFKIKSMPSKLAALGDLGWLPICDHLNIKRISYYEHLLNMDETRLTKVVYNQLTTLFRDGKNTAFKYVENINNLLIEKGLDFMFENSALVSSKIFKKATTQQYATAFQSDIYEKSSLLHYRVVKENTFQSKYLNCQDVGFKGIQLKFKLRAGV